MRDLFVDIISLASTLNLNIFILFLRIPMWPHFATKFNIATSITTVPDKTFWVLLYVSLILPDTMTIVIPIIPC